MNFSELQLSQEVLRAVADAGYTAPTPIQEQAIPVVLAGRDVLGCAQTGTGKTASFTLPMIDILAAGRAKARMPRSLILEPTRELAAQVAESFDTYGKHHKLAKALIIGGESMADQIKILERGADVLIATPGRLIDVFDRGHLLLNHVRILVIDEADRMLDMGFIPDVERIVSLVSRTRQTLFFSATMPPPIRRLADAFLINPKEIIVAPPATPAERIDQALITVAASGQTALKEKRAALRRLIDHEDVRSALIFCNRKRDVGTVCRSLVRHGYDAAMLHGDLAQAARTEVLDRFRRHDVRLLVCSDVAARGLDIDDLSHVFNFDVPTHAEDYVHRIGRTGRAGRRGRALTIALPEDGKYIAFIETLIGKPIEPLAIDGIAAAELVRVAARSRGRGRGKADGARPKSSPRPAEAGAAPRSAAKSEPRSAPKPAPRPAPRSAPKPAPRPEAKSGAAPPAKRPAKERRRPAAEAPVVGLGEHVPAFFLREIKMDKKD